MIPGPTIYRACALCGNHFLEDTVTSGNTFDACIWTDGKMDAPSLPDRPWLVKCPHCDALLWVDEQEKVGEYPPIVSERDLFDRASKFPGINSVITPTCEDYESFLENDIKDRAKERYARLRAWWSGNDQRRKGQTTDSLSSFEIQNMLALASLLNESDDNDRLMKAEIFRELGKFSEAEELLATKFSGGILKAVSIIRDLNQRQITEVTKMNL